MTKLVAGGTTTLALASNALYTWGSATDGPSYDVPTLQTAPIATVGLGSCYDTWIAVAENPTSLTPNETSVDVAFSETAQLGVSASIPSGGLYPAGSYPATDAAVWESNSNNTASVTNTGLVTANQSSGSATVSATLDGIVADITVTDTPPPAPTVTSVAPLSGTTSGGTVVTITGAGFVEVSGVSFGSKAAQSFTVKSLTSIVAIAPAGTAGTAAVTVSNTGGPSAANPGDVFTYSSSAVTITTASLPSGAVGSAYSATLAATGGTLHYKWKLYKGTLPKGLKLVATSGKISGTPTKKGDSSITIEVTDKNLINDTEALKIDIT